MPDMGFLDVSPDLRVPLAELEFRASRSGGPGGQHVNTSSTRVEVTWDVAGSPSLSEEQRPGAPNYEQQAVRAGLKNLNSGVSGVSA